MPARPVLVFITDDTDWMKRNRVQMPGFTAISMYPMLWEAAGISKKELIGKLIDLAFERDFV